MQQNFNEKCFCSNHAIERGPYFYGNKILAGDALPLSVKHPLTIMKGTIALFFLFCTVSAKAQRLSFPDLIKLTDTRTDTAAVFRYIRARGFSRRARTDDGNIVFMGDRDPAVRRFTEMVFVDLAGDEVQMIQYGTKSIDNYTSIRRQIAEDGSFTALPNRGETGEVVEGYSSREYLVHIETISKQARYVISIRPKPASRRR
jgi:hypothetical protein